MLPQTHKRTVRWVVAVVVTIGSCLVCSPSIIRPIQYWYLWRVAWSQDSAQRERALHKLITGYPDSCVSGLVTLAETGCPDQTGQAVYALFNLGIKRGRPALLRLLDSSNPVARLCAATKLGATGHVQDLEALEPLLNDADSWVRLEVATSLAESGRKAAVSHLIALLLDPNVEVATCARSYIHGLFPSGPCDYDYGHSGWADGAYRGWSDWWRTNRDDVTVKRFVPLGEPWGEE